MRGPDHLGSRLEVEVLLLIKINENGMWLAGAGKAKRCYKYTDESCRVKGPAPVSRIGIDFITGIRTCMRTRQPVCRSF